MCETGANNNKKAQTAEIDTGMNKVRLKHCMPKYGPAMPKYGSGVTDAQKPPNRFKREAVYIPDRDGKVRISFTPKYVATGGAGEGEENEYAQIRERHISVARRCLGKGKAKDKIVLDSAMWHILCAEEEKAGVPMEVEEHGAKDT